MMKLGALLLVVATAAVSHAQQLPATADSAIARALNLADNSDSTAARKLLDSLANGGDSPLLRGEAVYQLSRLAPSAGERERILTGLVIDHPFSPRLPDALLALGMLELARNDRDRAATHLTRYLSASAPPDTGRIAASLALGRLLLERGDLPRGCAALLVGRAELPESAIELKNQFEFSIGRCQGVDTTTKVDTRPVVDTTPAPRRTGAFTVQVAAYDTRAAADRLAKRLRDQGLEARAVGTSKPFRVRVGRYATRSEAEQASREVDAIAKSRSIVVIVGPEER
jgi:hypothetical protein